MKNFEINPFLPKELSFALMHSVAISNSRIREEDGMIFVASEIKKVFGSSKDFADIKDAALTINKLLCSCSQTDFRDSETIENTVSDCMRNIEKQVNDENFENFEVLAVNMSEWSRESVFAHRFAESLIYSIDRVKHQENDNSR